MIELMYARSEITHSESRNQQIARAAEHIQNAINTLTGLTPAHEERRTLASLLLEADPEPRIRRN
jgi:hypothetical protein